MLKEKNLHYQEKKKRLDHHLKEVEKRDRMLIKNRSEERAVLEEVFDQSTLMTVYGFLNKGIIDSIFGVVNSGKEARVYWGKDHQGNELAIKIYLTASAEFKKGMLPYLEGDPRFAHVKRDTRSLIYTWAQKEFKNLQKAQGAKVRVPKPIAISRNVLVMKFIGENGVSAPLLKESAPRNPEKLYQQILVQVERLYQKAGLVHADLSEYNIMLWKSKPVIFDFAQAVLVNHPMATKFLKRDLENLFQYFRYLNISILSVDEMYRRIINV